MYSKTTRSVFLVFMALLGIACGKPTDENAEIDGVKDKLEKDILTSAVEEQNELQQIDPSEIPDIEGFSRFFLTQVGTMMCYRTWEINPKIDFHECNVCFNETQLSEPSLSKNDHITRVESCFNKYLNGTDYNECLPMLRDSTIINKPYDILPTEPPFEFPFKNFGRCGYGIVFKQEAQKCVQPTDVVQGLEPFLEKFACLMKNFLVDSRRFSEANLKELLGSVPTGNGTRDGTKVI